MLKRSERVNSFASSHNMSSTTEKIKERLSIVDVLSSYISLERSGGSLKARCPFHHEKTPSFFVSTERNTYYCFGCGAKGDIFSFVQEFEHLDFLGALKLLAEKAGVTLEEFSSEGTDSKKRIFECLEEATQFFISELKKSSDALLYLKKRGLPIETVRDWRIGFAPMDWYALLQYLKSKGFSEQEIETAGLVKKGEKGGLYSRFRGRVMFPIFDGSSRVVAFSGRILVQTEEEQAKYINSPETPVFEKSKILYGYHKAKHAMREKGFAVLVEGQMDLLLSHVAGFSNTIASSGTAFTRDQADIIKRLADQIYIAYDADKAGQNAAFRAWQIALSAGLSVKAVTLPQGLDPADAILKDTELWKSALNSALPIIEYYAGLFSEDSKANDKLLKEKILPLIKVIPSAIEASRNLQFISTKIGISESALREELEKVSLPKEDQIEIVEAPKRDKEKLREKQVVLLGWFLQEKDKNIFQEFKDQIEQIISFGRLESAFLSQKDTLMFEAELHYANSPNLKQIIKETLYFFEEEILKEKFEEAMRELKKAEASHNEEKIKEKSEECHQISLKLATLKRNFNN